MSTESRTMITAGDRDFKMRCRINKFYKPLLKFDKLTFTKFTDKS